MLKRLLPIGLSFIFLLILASVPFLKFVVQPALSATSHAVISEVQISGDNGANDEFIELYNPTDSVIDLSSWSIQRETIGGTFEKKNFITPPSIPAHGYYLVANSSYNGSVSADLVHSSFTLSSTGTTVFLVNDQTLLTTGDETSIVDKIAIGSSSLDAEGTPFTTFPDADGSIERKPGTNDPLGGNGQDTDNNANDFVTRTTSDPQNRNSTVEPALTSPTPSPTIEPSVSPSATPDVTPSPTPDATPTPSATPEATPSPTPETSPSPTPDVTPSPTTTPSPTATPTVSPSTSPSPRTNFAISCNVTYRAINFRWFTVYLPSVRCSLIRT